MTKLLKVFSNILLTCIGVVIVIAGLHWISAVVNSLSVAGCK